MPSRAGSGERVDGLTDTADEWASLVGEGRRFARVVEDTAVWVFDKD
jgi:hypothetical protein